MATFEELQAKVDARVGRYRRILQTLSQRARRFVALHGRRGIAENEDGSALIEFAVSLSVFMGFMFTLMQLSLALYSYGMITECAREATRWASTRGSTCTTAAGASCTATTTTVSAYARGLGFPNLGGGTMLVTTTYPDTNPVGGAANCEASGCRVKVVITYTVAISLPYVPKHSISLESFSEMYILQ